jgi:hypothetical protein
MRVMLRRGGRSIPRVRRLYPLDGPQVHMRIRRPNHIALHPGPPPRRPDATLEPASLFQRPAATTALYPTFTDLPEPILTHGLCSKAGRLRQSHSGESIQQRTESIIP